MKCKFSFISNSSSSSFIVAWPSKINVVDDVGQFIEDRFKETVFRDAKSQTPLITTDPLAIKLLMDELKDGDFGKIDFFKLMNNFCKRENISERDLYNHPSWLRNFHRDTDIKTDHVAYEEAISFLEEIPNDSYIYIFEYSDSDGSYFAEMEHGSIFRKLPYIRINKH